MFSLLHLKKEQLCEPMPVQCACCRGYLAMLQPSVAIKCVILKTIDSEYCIKRAYSDDSCDSK